MNKFATQMSGSTLRELRKFSKESKRSISGIVTEAVEQYLERARVRPAFREATDEVIAEHAELLERLAK